MPKPYNSVIALLNTPEARAQQYRPPNDYEIFCEGGARAVWIGWLNFMHKNPMKAKYAFKKVFSKVPVVVQ